MSSRTVAAKIRQWMHENDCESLRKAAPRLGLHYTYLGRLLKGQNNPTMAKLEQLAERMGTTAADLLSVDSPEDQRAS